MNNNFNRTLKYLTQEQINQFHQDGYLRVPAFLSQDETQKLLIRSKELLDNFSLDDHPLTKFTTSEENHIGDEYFLTSGDKMSVYSTLPMRLMHTKDFPVDIF